MKKVALLWSLATGAVLLCGTFAHAACPVEAPYACFFYGGDLDPNNPNSDGLSNENDGIVSGNPYGAAVYQNFLSTGLVPINGLATNNLSALSPATAYWEIRANVSEGNGGTLIASGTGATSNQPTGRTFAGYNEYTSFVGGLDVNIGAGNYWMAVVPQDPNDLNRAFESNTFGLNSIGNQITGQQFWNSPFFGASYDNTESSNPFLSTFSSAAYYAVPEPSSMIMLGSGLFAAASVILRRLPL